MCRFIFSSLIKATATYPPFGDLMQGDLIMENSNKLYQGFLGGVGHSTPAYRTECYDWRFAKISCAFAVHYPRQDCLAISEYRAILLDLHGFNKQRMPFGPFNKTIGHDG